MVKVGKKLRKSDFCLNCGRELGDFNYCPDCGQINTHKQISFIQIVKELLGEFFTFDSKFFRSFVPLVKKPGHLTTEYIVGRRTTYILPMRLFVFTTVLYFFMMALNGIGDSEDEFLSQRISKPADSLSLIFDKYDKQVSDETRTLLIDDITDSYDIYTKEKRILAKEKKLLDKISEYNLESSSESNKYFVLKLFKNFKLNNRKEFSYQLTIGKKDTKIDSLRAFINNNAPDGLNEDDRFLIYLVENYRIKIRKQTSDDGFEKVENDTSMNFYLKEFLKKTKNFETAGGYGKKIFIKEFLNQMSKLVFCMVPILALLLKIFYIRSKIYYINHLIFSLHIHSVLLMLLLIPLILGFFDPGSTITGISYLTVISVFLVYVIMALKRVYRQKGVKTFIKLLSIGFIYLFLYGIGMTVFTVYVLYNNF